MDFKIISLNKVRIEDGRVIWNHRTFNLDVLEKWLVETKEKYAISDDTYENCLKYVGIRQKNKSVNIDRLIRDILSTLPPRYECEKDWRYLNHLAILKVDILINAIYRVGYNKPQRIVEMLDKLIKHANESSAPCFQVSIHYACKFFLAEYPESADDIKGEIAIESHQDLMKSFENSVGKIF